MHNRSLFITTAVVTLLLFAAGSSAFGSPSKTFGFRAGFGLDPDQVVVGLQGRVGELIPNVRIAPSADLGFGDDLTVFSGNADLLVPLSPPGSRLAFYIGGGPTLSHFDPKFGDGDTELGVSAVVGIKLPFGRIHNWTVEGRYGIGDVPEVRVVLGILFGSQPRSDEE